MKNGFTKGRIVNFLNVNVTNFRAYKILITKVSHPNK